MATPPFELDIVLNETPGSFTLNMDLYFERDDDEPPEEDDYDGSRQVVELFLAAVNEGMFSRAVRGQPVPARLKELESRWDASAAALRYRFAAESVPADCFLSLIALLTQTHHALEPLGRLALRTAEPGGQTLSAAVLLAPEPIVPPRIEPLPFAMEEPDPDLRKSIEIRLEFQKPLAPDKYDYVADAINIWNYLVLLGAFAFDFEEIDGLGNLNRVNHESPQVIRIDMDSPPDSPSAFNAIINLATRLHHEGLQLERITIE